MTALCIIILQDEHYKNADKYSKPDELAKNCLNLLKQNFTNYQEQAYSIQNLKSIAALRYCLSQVADVLYKMTQNETKAEEWTEVIEYISETIYSSKGKYHGDYFIKYIVRQYGTQPFMEMRKANSWIVSDDVINQGKKVYIMTVYYCTFYKYKSNYSSVFA